VHLQLVLSSFSREHTQAPSLLAGEKHQSKRLCPITDQLVPLEARPLAETPLKLTIFYRKKWRFVPLSPPFASYDRNPS